MDENSFTHDMVDLELHCMSGDALVRWLYEEGGTVFHALVKQDDVYALHLRSAYGMVEQEGHDIFFLFFEAALQVARLRRQALESLPKGAS